MKSDLISLFFFIITHLVIYSVEFIFFTIKIEVEKRKSIKLVDCEMIVYGLVMISK